MKDVKNYASAAIVAQQSGLSSVAG